MKTLSLKKISIVLFFLFVGIGIQTTQAQFWKKLEERVSEEVEEAVIRKTTEKSVEKTEESVEAIFEAPGKARKKKKQKKKGKQKRDDDSSENEEIDSDENESNERENETEESAEVYNETEVEENDSPETNTPKSVTGNYSFEWKYVLKMESAQTKKHKKNRGDMKITYYLNPNTTTFASKFDMDSKGSSPMENMLMVMDMESGLNLILMDLDGQKIMQKMPSIMSNDVEDTVDEQAENKYTIVKIDTKTILGYQCQGFKITSEDGIITTYIAKNAPVSFNQAFAGNSKFKPKGFKTEWLKEIGSGLMLEMQFTSNKKKKHNMKMTCVELVEEPFSVNLSEYESF